MKKCLASISLITVLLVQGCALGSGRVARTMEAPVRNIDVSTLSANLPEGKSLLFEYSYDSLQPGGDLSILNDSQLTLGGAVELMRAGAGLASRVGPYKVASDLVNKDRRLATTIIIADSEDIKSMRQSDNRARLVQNVSNVDLLNRLVVEEPQIDVNALADRLAERLAPDQDLTGDASASPDSPGPALDEWRSDLSTIPASAGVIEFRTRGIQPAPGNGTNQNGGFEWIIARVTGAGFNRLLIMVMGGDRPPSRIYFEAADGSSSFVNNVFPVPLNDEAVWRVETVAGAIRVLLNGEEIYRKDGAYTVQRAVMNGYPQRGFIGQWRQ